MKLPLLLSLTIVISGCASMGITEQKTLSIDTTEEGGANVSMLEIGSAPAQLRNVYVWTNGKEKWVCPEPYPDVAASTSFEATANAVNSLTQAINQGLEVEQQRQRERDISATEDGASNARTGSFTGSDSLNSNNSFDSSLSQSLEVGMKAVSTMLALKGRSELTVLNTNAMSSLCILAANGFLSDDSPAYKHMGLILEGMVAMVEADRARANADEADAKAELAKADAKKAEAEAALKASQTAADKSILNVLKPIWDKELADCKKSAAADKVKEKKCNDDYESKLKPFQSKKD